jgi:hypothetical protein
MIQHFLLRNWALLLSLVVYGLVVVWMGFDLLASTNGIWIYPLDDTYIHMAIAKNTALYGVWGVTRYEFTSATSSPLWTGLLAVGYMITGVNDWLPLALNIGASIATLIVTYQLLRRWMPHQALIALALVSALLTCSLPALTLIGMEHTLHVGLTICLVLMLVKFRETPDWRTLGLLAVVGALLVATRYEGLFVVAIAAIILLTQRKYLQSIVFGAASGSLILLYGLYSLAQGWYLLPNSILMKSSLGQDLSKAFEGLLFGERIWWLLLFSGYLLPIFVSVMLVYVLLHRKRLLTPQEQMLTWAFFGNLLLHMQFAAIGWLFRYDAYLGFLGIIVLGILLYRFWGHVQSQKRKVFQPLLVVVSLLFVVFYCAQRASDSIFYIPKSAINIYEQQFSMARFIQEFYQGQTIVLNDIGFVTYLADVRVLDVAGLASMESARLQLANQWNPAELGRWAQTQNAQIALVYDTDPSKPSIIPASWVKVGEWTIDEVIMVKPTVGIYAVDPTQAPTLARNMAAFSPQLPNGVAQRSFSLAP